MSSDNETVSENDDGESSEPGSTVSENEDGESNEPGSTNGSEETKNPEDDEEDRSIVSEDDEQETNQKEQIEKKEKENFTFILRVVVPHAFIKPPRPNYDDMKIEDLEDRLEKVFIKKEDLPKIEDKEDHKKQLKDILTTKEESAVLQKNTKIGVMMLLKYKEDGKLEDLTCQIPLESDSQNNFYDFHDAKDNWEEGKTNVLPARSEFGLIHFPSGYRFDFRNLSKNIADEIKYLEIRLFDSETKNRLAISKIKAVKVKNKPKPISLSKWLRSWFENGHKTEHICFSEKAQPYDPLAPTKKKEGGEEGEEDKESEEGEEDSNDDTDPKNFDTWMKVNLFLFAMDDEEDLHVPKCKDKRKKNEYPVMPNEEETKLIKIHSIKPLKLMFDRFQTVLMRDEIIDFAILRCHYSIFNHVLALCLLRSNNPLKTALMASQLCEKRMEQVNGGTEHWEQKSKACLEIAIRIGETIPKLQEKLQDTKYYEAAAEHILDQNLVFAVEKEMIKVLHSNVFSDRTYKRWMHRRMTIFPFFPQISPCISFLGQALLFFIFCIIFTYVASTSYQIYNFNWMAGFDNNMFGIQGVDTTTFWDIDDSDSFYTWMENMFVPQIFSDTSNYSSSPTSLYWYLITPYVVVRQIRVLPQNCTYLPNLTCYESLFSADSGAVEDTSPQFAGYNYYPDLGGLLLLGISPTNRYNTGGYTVFLEGTATDVLGQIEEMKNRSFIDPATRAIIIEFAIFSPNAGLFMMFEILVEYTHIGVVYTNRAMVVQQPLSDGQLEKESSLTLYYVLTAFIVGYILQEVAEMIVMCHSRVKELERRAKQEAEENDSSDQETKFKILEKCCPCKEATPNNNNEENDGCCTSCVAQVKGISGDPFSRIVSATLHTVTNHYTSDIWNILDFFVNSMVVLFLLLVYIQHFAFNFVPNSETQVVEIHNLWISEVIIETANITASIGLVMAWLRVLYFALPVRTVGPLVIGMLRMYKDVLYFIFLMTVFLFGFTTAFDIIFAGTLESYTGYGTSSFSTLLLSLGSINYADSSIFLQLPLKWFGNVVIIIYVLISCIILVNLLISMMGGTYETLQNTIEAKWRHLFGELLLHYERFVLMPPPLNIPHIMLYSIVNGFPIKISHGKWKLVGQWQHDEEWKVQHHKLLYQERLNNQPGPFSRYSTNYWVQLTYYEIEDEIKEGLENNHKKVIKHIKKIWAKGIQDRIFEKQEIKLVKLKEKIIEKIKREDKKKNNDDQEPVENDDDDLDEEDEPGDNEIETEEDIIKKTINNIEESTFKMWFEERHLEQRKKEENREEKEKERREKERREKERREKEEKERRVKDEEERREKEKEKNEMNKKAKIERTKPEFKKFWKNRIDSDSSSIINDSSTENS